MQQYFFYYFLYLFKYAHTAANGLRLYNIIITCAPCRREVFHIVFGIPSTLSLFVHIYMYMYMQSYRYPARVRDFLPLLTFFYHFLFPLYCFLATRSFIAVCRGSFSLLFPFIKREHTHAHTCAHISRFSTDIYIIASL